MTTLEIARKLAQLGQEADACKAFGLMLSQGADPEERLEAANYLFGHHPDHRVAYTEYIKLYQEGLFREEIMPLLIQAFYEPNIRLLKNRYQRNCLALANYPYWFRRDFPSFEDLPISFFPFQGESGYLPFDMESRSFGDFVDVKDPVVSRNFFHDLDQPVLAQDVYSQYELEYLNDNIRKSEVMGRDNHLYLHYSSFETFCAWLQVLDLRRLLEDKKPVFLFEEERALYPLDFKERFGVDYGAAEAKPLSIREVHRIIWHTQLSTHNGGDFFNEIFDNHPNLIFVPSMMFENIDTTLKNLRTGLRKSKSLQEAYQIFDGWDRNLVADLYYIKRPTDKDLLVAWFMSMKSYMGGLDRYSRIAPAVFLQPHFPNIVYSIETGKEGQAVLDSEQVKDLHNSNLFRSFKYVKTFTPLRRFTTSHGATVKFMYNSFLKQRRDNPNAKTKTVVPDAVTQRVLNRSFMRDPDQRIYRDSIIVRFEDGKLNPKATLPKLAAFLDLPYTESMTYCSDQGRRNVQTMEGNDIGFDPAAIYRTYDEFVNDSERKYIEYFLRDAYEYYGYDTQYYDGGPVDMDKIKEWISGFEPINRCMMESHRDLFQDVKVFHEGKEVTEDTLSQAISSKMMDDFIQRSNTTRTKNAEILMRGLFFINRAGQPLRMTPMLQPDPELLEQPLYH